MKIRHCFIIVVQQNFYVLTYRMNLKHPLWPLWTIICYWWNGYISKYLLNLPGYQLVNNSPYYHLIPVSRYSRLLPLHVNTGYCFCIKWDILGLQNHCWWGYNRDRITKNKNAMKKALNLLWTMEETRVFSWAALLHLVVLNLCIKIVGHSAVIHRSPNRIITEE